MGVRAYVFERDSLVERLELRTPIPTVRLAIRQKIFPSFAATEAEFPEPYLKAKDYECKFRSMDNRVMIYADTDPMEFLELALKNVPIFKDRKFLFASYQTEAKLTYENREVLEDLILDAIKLARNERNDKGDKIIAEVIAKRIDVYFRNYQSNHLT